MPILLAGLYFAVALVLHAIWCHRAAQPSVVVKFVIVGGLTGLALLGHVVAMRGLTTDTLAGLLVFALAEAYSPTWMVETSLERLVEIGFLVRDGDASRLTEKGRSLIGSFSRLRAIFKHERRA